MIDDEYDEFNELYESPRWDSDNKDYCLCGCKLKSRTEKYGDFYREEVYCPRCND